jgi:hypothetical protein
MKWREYIEDGFCLIIPQPLRRTRLGPLFKGTITKGIPGTELLVNFTSDVNAYIINDWKKAALKPPPFTEWNGFIWTYYSWGASKTRAKGLESKFTQTASNQYGRGHSWTIIFPIVGKWVQLDIANGNGGLEWAEFEDIAEKIITSVEAI